MSRLADRRRRLRGAFTLALPVAALLLCAAPVEGGGLTAKLTSGLLEGRHAYSLLCAVVNRSGGPVDDVIITIRDEGGDPLAGPTEFDGVGDGQTRSESYTISGSPVAGYCEVSVPPGSRVVANLRLQTSGGETVTATPLRTDTHGKIQELIDKLGSP